MQWLIPSLICLFLSTSNGNSPDSTSATDVEKDGINDVENAEGIVEGASSSVASGSDAHMAEMLAKKYAHYHDMSANGIANHDMSNEPLDYVEKHHSLHAKMTGKDNDADLKEEKHLLQLDQYLLAKADPNFARIMRENALALASDTAETDNELLFKNPADEPTLAKERQSIGEKLQKGILNDEIEKLIHEMLKDVKYNGKNNTSKSESSVQSNLIEFAQQEEPQMETNTNEEHRPSQGEHSIRKAQSMDDLRAEHYSGGPSSPAASYSSVRTNPSSSVHENAMPKGYRSPNHIFLSSPLNEGKIARAHSDPMLKNVKTASVLKRSRSESDILFGGKANVGKKGKSPNWQGYDSLDFSMPNEELKNGREVGFGSLSSSREHSDSGDDSADDFAQRRIEGVMPKKEKREKMEGVMPKEENEGEMPKDKMEKRNEEIEKLEMKHAQSKQASSALALSHNHYPPQHPIHSRHPIHFETVQKPERVKSLPFLPIQRKITVPKRSKSVGIDKEAEKVPPAEGKHRHLDAAGKLDISKIVKDIRKRRRMLEKISDLNKRQQQQQQQHVALVVNHSPEISRHSANEEIQLLPHPEADIEKTDLIPAAEEYGQQNENQNWHSESSSQLHAMAQPKKRNSRLANIFKSIGTKKGKAGSYSALSCFNERKNLKD